MSSQAEITVYTTRFCPYCSWAKRLLNGKEVTINEIPVDGAPDVFDAMVERSNGAVTVPQIFIGDTHIGGFDDMSALDRMGKLDPLLFPDT